MRLREFAKEVIAEYPHYGNQKSGSNPVITGKQSPNSQSQPAPPKPGQKPQPEALPVKDLKKDSKFQDANGNIVTVMSPVGDSDPQIPDNSAEVAIVKTDKGDTYAVNADDLITAGPMNEVAHNKIAALLQRKNEFRRLIRKARFDKQGELLYEINFNNASVIKSVLDANIACGFEAESVWPDIEGEIDLDNATWGDVEAYIEMRYGGEEISKLEQAHKDWIMESDQFLELEHRVIMSMVHDQKEDEDKLNQYVNDMVDKDAVEEYKEEVIADIQNQAKNLSDLEARQAAQEEYKERQGWDDYAWAREYVEEEDEAGYEEWLADKIRDNGEHWDQTWEIALEEITIEKWMQMEYGTWYDLLADHDLYLGAGSEEGLDEIATRLQDWAMNEGNSISGDVRPGEYHSGKSVDNDYWRVEEDSSIDGDGTGAEIISPVYNSPREMLREMNSLFEFFEKNNVDTNTTTGLHVTMSIVGNKVETNPLKLVLLLGDRYALQQFGRRFNTYSESQIDILQRKLDSALDDPESINDQEFQDLEKQLSTMIHYNKFVSANFQNKENPDGNQLIEFRIADGNNYHKDFRKVTQAVVRYAATMQAAHDPRAFREDYIKALYKLVQQTKEANKRDIDPSAVSQIQKLGLPDTPLVDFVIKYSKYYPENVENLAKLLNHKSKKITDEKKSIGARIIVNLIGEIRSKNIAAVGTPQEIRAFKSLFRMSGVKISDILNSDRLNRNAKESFLHFLRMKDPTPEATKELRIPRQKVGFMFRSDYKNIEKLPDPNSKIQWVDYPDYNSFARIFSNNTDLTDQQKQQIKQIFIDKYGFIPGEPGKASDDEYVRVDLGSPQFIEIMRRAGVEVVKESVFSKFDKLPLVEQLQIIRRIDDKKLDQVWHKSNEANRKKKEIAEGCVPDYDVPRELRRLFRQPLRAGDIRAQMEAYVALPVPEMVSEFRSERARAGDDYDLRPVLKKYVDEYLHSSEKQKVAESVLVEARGVMVRSPGDRYVSTTDSSDVLTIKELFLVPDPSTGNDSFETPDELNDAINQIIPSDDVYYENSLNSSMKAALIAHVEDAEGKDRYYVRFVKAIPAAGAAGRWATITGYKFDQGTKSESLPVKPSDLIPDENFRGPKEIRETIISSLSKSVTGTEHEELVFVMEQAIDQAMTNGTAPITGAKKYEAVLAKYAGEFLGPIALIAGNIEGDTSNMLEVMGIDSLRNGKVSFPQDAAMPLIDSIMQVGDKEIYISSKIHKAGGAASSLSGLEDKVTDEMRSKYPRAAEIFDIINKSSAKQGPLIAAVKLKLISEQVAHEINQLDKSLQDSSGVSTELAKVLKNYPPKTTEGSYRVYFHALAAVVKVLVDKVNDMPEMQKFIIEALNNNGYLQLLTKTKKTGDDLILEYYTKFPAVFDGFPALYNKSYDATRENGKLGFKLLKSKPAAEHISAVPKIKQPPKQRPGELATAKPEPVNTDLGRKEVQ